MNQRQHRAESTRPTRASTLNQVPPTLRDVAQQALDFLEPRLQRVFVQTVAGLETSAESADSLEARRAMLESARFLTSCIDAVNEDFAAEFLRGFDPASQTGRRREGGAKPTGELGGAQVLNGDAFELSVAVSTVTSRSASQHKAYIDRITPALEATRGSAYSSRRNPLSVFRITGAFMSAVGRLQLDTSVQRLLLDEFEAQVINDLGGLYGDVCRALRLDTRLDDDAGSNGHPEDADIALHPAAEAASGGAASGVGTASAEFDELRLLIHGQVPGGAMGPPRGVSGAGRGGPIISTEDLLRALTAVQLDSGQFEAGQPIDLRALAGSALAGMGGELDQVDDVAQDTLQLVSLLFEHILHDESISLPLASLISRLQIPVLKVAMTDTTLFDDPDHVVRRVINRLADVGLGWWGDTDQVRDDPLYKAIDAIVSRIVDGCHDDDGVFAEADAALDDTVSRSANRTKSLEKRLTERESGKVKVEAARRAVQTLINSRASGLRLPDGIRDFIKQAWTQVMVYLCVRHGPQSNDWREAAETLDELLALGQPAAREEDLAQRAEQLPFLFEHIEHWLHVAGFHAAQAEDQVRDLYAGFQELAEHDRAWFEAGAEYEVHELDEMDVVELVPADAAAVLTLDAELEPLLDGVRPGTWVEFVMDGEPRNRSKLSMVFEQSRNHLFVDHRGLKVCELTATEVAEALRDGAMRELKADPVVERALDEMISELRASMGASFDR
ncbi:MAG: DUF1631 family protein [Gammaproteobacteria bacterium]|nr:DUF1631 family protein [Gammaproteobacteria bacterium]